MATYEFYLSTGLDTNTNADSINNSAFVNTYWYQNRTQCIVTASELTTLGFQSGDTFLRIGSYATELGGRPTIADYRIGIAHTTATTLSAWYAWSNFTLVYGPTSLSMSSYPTNTYAYVDLADQTFAWNGTNNIIIDLSRTDTAYSGTTGKLRVCTDEVSGNTFAGNADSSTFPYVGTGTAYPYVIDYYFQVNRTEGEGGDTGNTIIHSMNF